MDPSTALALDETPSVIDELSAPIEGPAALLRGTARGLEMAVNGRAPIEAVIAALVKRLDEAPGFFRGSNVRIVVEHGPLASGALARLDELAGTFALSIIEVGAAKAKDPVPRPNLAAGSGPTTEMFGDEEPTGTVTPAALLAKLEVAGTADAVQLAPAELTEVVELPAPAARILGDEPPDNFEEATQTGKAPIALAPMAEMPAIPAPQEGTRLVIGPVRSGVILEHEGHLFIFGDVNPGAEVRATGNIVVLGRLRGTAHAAIGHDVGFILALRLEPQQLRIGRRVTRAGDDATPPTDSEIAYLAGDAIVVERYLGKLPRNLATSI